MLWRRVMGWRQFVNGESNEKEETWEERQLFRLFSSQKGEVNPCKGHSYEQWSSGKNFSQSFCSNRIGGSFGHFASLRSLFLLQPFSFSRSRRNATHESLFSFFSLKSFELNHPKRRPCVFHTEKLMQKEKKITKRKENGIK